MYAPRKNRVIPVLAAVLAATAVSAGPAFAGSDGSVEAAPPTPPAQTVPVVPPATPSPLEAGSGDTAGSEESGGSAPEQSGKSSPRSHRTVQRVRATRQVAHQTTPQGGVGAGAGGMAPDAPDGILLPLAGVALALIASGGGLVARGRRAAA